MDEFFGLHEIAENFHGRVFVEPPDKAFGPIPAGVLESLRGFGGRGEGCQAIDCSMGPRAWGCFSICAQGGRGFEEGRAAESDGL